MRCVERFTRFPTRRQPIKTHGRRFAASLLVVTIFSSSTVVVSSLTASASNIANARASATVLYQQIQSMGGRVEALGQKYDLARINLQRFNNQIKNSKVVVAQIELKLTKDTNQLRKDAIFAYVTNGTASSLNPIFSPDRLKAGAT